MGQAKTKKPSARSIAKKYGIHNTTVSDWLKAGVDIYNDALMLAKVAEIQAVPEILGVNIKLTSPVAVQGLGLAASIDRLREVELASHKDYLTAIIESPSLAPKLLKDWLNVVKSLREVEEKNPAILEANKNTVSLEELAKIIGETFNNLKQDLEALPRKFATLTEGTTDKLQKEAIAKEEVEKILESLFSCKFLE